MLHTTTITLPTSEPLALLDATLLFIIQVLIARHPDLLAPPEEPAPATAGLRAAGRIFDAVRELHVALDGYRTVLPGDAMLARGDEWPGDDIPS